MGTLQFLFAIWALLLTPGPTNTLLALAGATGGFTRTTRLMPAELVAYLLVSVPLAMAGAEALAQWPDAARLVKLAAAAWVAVLAVKLWRVPVADSAPAQVTAARLFVTTLLNPKALVIGLVLLPRGSAPEFPLHLAVLAASILAIASLWAALGAWLQRGALTTPRLLRRVAACWLALLAVGLAGAALSA